MQDPMREDGIEMISSAMARFRVLIGRRVLSRIALTNLAPALDMADLDILGVIPGTLLGPIHCPQAEDVSVGDIARHLHIDPSRASRLVAGLVDRGFLIRAVSQHDARRAVLLRTEAGDRIFAEISRIKLELIREITGGWPEERLLSFAASFDDFTTAFEARIRSDQKEKG
ncbi:MarR family winged helix-turn-helix transcriptional regulator [Paracoccus sp. MBLB3053]|uniref:MarR family winged helix-turn-helix transcriptional regulator n=1 Tax=Paracoccus aurantius TaxID=3073814 RepID=A0ABU2HWH8_9RHOB|nr:MarR family winged helix-turn-helix transcriptional regulator [Paracoccus sp. MBLB3053]MDS9469411.1 MarR family winged helix-turn-helix transcriptional regulator [Paracoccus sp. MBLB3053]